MWGWLIVQTQLTPDEYETLTTFCGGFHHTVANYRVTTVNDRLVNNL